MKALRYIGILLAGILIVVLFISVLTGSDNPALIKFETATFCIVVVLGAIVKIVDNNSNNNNNNNSGGNDE